MNNFCPQHCVFRSPPGKTDHCRLANRTVPARSGTNLRLGHREGNGSAMSHVLHVLQCRFWDPGRVSFLATIALDKWLAWCHDQKVQFEVYRSIERHLKSNRRQKIHNVTHNIDSIYVAWHHVNVTWFQVSFMCHFILIKLNWGNPSVRPRAAQRAHLDPAIAPGHGRCDLPTIQCIACRPATTGRHPQSCGRRCQAASDDLGATVSAAIIGDHRSTSLHRSVCWPCWRWDRLSLT